LATLALSDAGVSVHGATSSPPRPLLGTSHSIDENNTDPATLRSLSQPAHTIDSGYGAISMIPKHIVERPAAPLSYLSDFVHKDSSVTSRRRADVAVDINEPYTENPIVSERDSLLSRTEQQEIHNSISRSVRFTDLEARGKDSSTGDRWSKGPLSWPGQGRKQVIWQLRDHWKPSWKTLFEKGLVQPAGYLPAVMLGLLLNILDGLSYGKLKFSLFMYVTEN
jgi:hypothetical protein